MADLARIKRNVAKMAGVGAPTADIDGYIKSEGVTVADVRNFQAPTADTSRRSLLDEAVRRTGQVFGIPYEQPIPTPDEIAAGQKPLTSAALRTSHDVLTIPTEFFNQAAFNLPRGALREFGFDIPTETENPVAGGARNVAGVTGLIRSGISRGIAGQFFRRGSRLRSKAAGGALGGFIYTPDEGATRIGERATQAAFGALVPTTLGGLQKTGQFFNAAGRWISREFGGVTDATVDIIKRLGVQKVFDPLKARSDYLGAVVAPKAHARIVQAITDVGGQGRRVLAALGVKSDQLKQLQTVSQAARQKLALVGGETADELATRIGAMKDSAAKQFARAMPSDARVNIRGPLLSLKRDMQRQGWIDAQGNEIAGAGISNRTRTNLGRILRFYSKEGQGGEVLARGAGTLNGRQYLNLLSELEASTSGNVKFDRLAFAAQANFRRTAARQIPKLKDATQAYADASKLQELQPALARLDNIVNLEQKVLSLKNTNKPQLHQQWRTILGKDLYDDVLGHLANQDFSLTSSLPGAGGALYPSRAGFLRQFIARGSKKYYRDVLPFRQSVEQRVRRGTDVLLNSAGYGDVIGRR